MVSLEDYFEGPNADITWHHVDSEFNDFAIEQLDSAGGLIFGRKTYSMMSSYWPSQYAIDDDPIVAEKMNSLPKFVFSKTLDQVDWNNTTLLKGNAVEQLTTLKQQPGKDLFIFGSAGLASTFSRQGLIDEYRLMVNPVIIGCGEPLFKNLDEKIDLRLLQTRTFKNGNVLLTYEHA
jgi:dihydrofolate reductase